VFENPPVSTQQILHPDLYLRGVVPLEVKLPDLSRDLPKEWKNLETNVLGEYGLQELLKQFLGEARADELSPVWAGDRYAFYEKQDTKESILLLRIRTGSEEGAARLFGGLSEALEKKYTKRENLMRRPNFFSFSSDQGGVFLRCSGADCVSLEGGDRKLFDAVVRALGWTANPPLSGNTERQGVATTHSKIPIPPSLAATPELHPRGLAYFPVGVLLGGAGVFRAAAGGEANTAFGNIMCTPLFVSTSSVMWRSAATLESM
jgi:hypothetical protein